ncbi:hypothetical protein BHM03_00001878 [Ensete ventricosum]|nr:hypothetical protein BHM03_00001878 [Ensete ventricosum]
MTSWRARSSFSQKDALALFPHPHCVAAVALVQATAALARWQRPLRSAPLPLLATALAVGCSPLRAGRWGRPLQASCCKRLSPLQAGRSRPPPIQGALVAAGLLCRALATIGRPLACG